MDKLIGDKAHHPSLKLEAGQVQGFHLPVGGGTICSHCGKAYSDTTYHPNASYLPDGLVTYGGNPVTYGGNYVTYGV